MTRPPLTRVQARNCFLANQFATPGIGSLMARRWLAGFGQLLICLAGFVISCVGFVRLCIEAYRSLQSGIDLGLPSSRLMFLGVGIVAIAWVWALFTSLSLRREAAGNEPWMPDNEATSMAPKPPTGPPPIR